MYCIEVEENHNYFVGKNNILVHNKETITKDNTMNVHNIIETSPVEIPENARIVARKMKQGYFQVRFRWNDGTYRWEARWHTRTPGAPLTQRNTWVIKREIIGTSTSEFLLNDGSWAKGYDWYKAIGNRQSGIITVEESILLDKGHIPE